jgi:hypothetical protein
MKVLWCFLRMGFNLDAIYHFVATCELVIGNVIQLITLHLLIVVRGVDRELELKVSAVELNVDEFIDELADDLTIARPETLDLETLDVGDAELLEVIE